MTTDTPSVSAPSRMPGAWTWSWIGLLISMVMHGVWLHLLMSLAVLACVGPLVEAVFWGAAGAEKHAQPLLPDPPTAPGVGTMWRSEADAL